MRRSISTPLAVLAELFVIYLIFNLLNKEDSEYNEEEKLHLESAQKKRLLSYQQPEKIERLGARSIPYLHHGL